MNGQLDPAALPNDNDWPRNYFNYFTEIEEHFRQARGTGLFLLSPLDWALIENWKNSGIPIEAVLKGIDDAFEKWRSRKNSRRLVNSLAYCSQAILEAAQRAPGTRTGAGVIANPFTGDELSEHLSKAATALCDRPEPAFHEIASSLKALSGEVESLLNDLEALERRLTSLEEKMIAILRASQRDEDLLSIRESLDRELKPYRGKMTADQLAMLQRRYLDNALLERAKLPRFSLFYLR